MSLLPYQPIHLDPLSVHVSSHRDVQLPDTPGATHPKGNKALDMMNPTIHTHFPQKQALGDSQVAPYKLTGEDTEVLVFPLYFSFLNPLSALT